MLNYLTFACEVDLKDNLKMNNCLLMVELLFPYPRIFRIPNHTERVSRHCGKHPKNHCSVSLLLPTDEQSTGQHGQLR